MTYPFPGMNPYLEHPALWTEVHNHLIVAIASVLNRQLRPKYRVAVDQRTYLSISSTTDFVGRPDVAVVGQRSPVGVLEKVEETRIHSQPLSVELPMPETLTERYLEVREIPTGEVVTAIELLSPSNKRAGEGRRVYIEKRNRVLGRLSHFVEIDLLRNGEPMPIVQPQVVSAYRLLVSRSDRRPSAELYAFGLREEIPTFAIPLRSGDVEPTVDLGALLRDVYERGSFDLAIDYERDPTSPVSEEEARWIDEQLREANLRGGQP
jgi:Protein of unknown function (DUF4058)